MLYQTVNNIKICYSKELNGGGSESISDSLQAVKLLLGNSPKCDSVLEWCSGPGFWGFSLLSLKELQINNLTLTDIYEPVKEYVQQTIDVNNLSNVSFYNSYNFDTIPNKHFDLIIGNPPHFCIDPFDKYYDDPRKYKDKDWKIHENFFQNASNYLTSSGKIILQENIWGSSPRVFEDMINSNGLQIDNVIRSKKFINELWYMSISKVGT